MKKVVRNLVLVCLCFCIITLAFPSVVLASNEATPKLSKTSMTMYVSGTSSKSIPQGQFYFLTVRNATERPIWSSSNKKVVTVSKNGTVVARKAGKGVITAKVGTKKLKCEITVKKEPKSTIIEKEVVITKMLQNTTLQTTVQNNLPVSVKVYYKVKEYDINGVLLTTTDEITYVNAKENVINLVKVKEGTNYVDIIKTVTILNKCLLKDANTPYNSEVVMGSSDIDVNVDKIEFIEGWMGKEAKITYTMNNKSFQTSDGEFYIVFYLDDKIVGFEKVITLRLPECSEKQSVFSSDWDSCLRQDEFKYDTFKVVKGSYYTWAKSND